VPGADRRPGGASGNGIGLASGPQALDEISASFAEPGGVAGTVVDSTGEILEEIVTTAPRLSPQETWSFAANSAALLMRTLVFDYEDPLVVPTGSRRCPCFPQASLPSSDESGGWLLPKRGASSGQAVVQRRTQLENSRRRMAASSLETLLRVRCSRGPRAPSRGRTYDQCGLISRANSHVERAAQWMFSRIRAVCRSTVSGALSIRGSCEIPPSRLSTIMSSCLTAQW